MLLPVPVGWATSAVMAHEHTIGRWYREEKRMAGERKRRTYREIFLDALTRLSNGEQKLISNIALRQELDWDEEGYNQIKR
jgi:hypothetical protein